MADGFIHTVYKREIWLNEVEGGDEIAGNYSTKEEAVAAGRARAQADKTEQRSPQPGRQHRRAQLIRGRPA